MKTTATKWAARAAGTGAIALLLAAPSFAQSRGDWSRNNQSNRGAQATQTRAGDHQFNNNNNTSQQNTYRENQRGTVTERSTSFTRERDGYRGQGDRGRSYRAPEFRERGFRSGLSLSIGVGYPAYGYGYAYNNAAIRGVVDTVDYRTGIVWIRDEASGQEIRAAVGSGYALEGLHRGELVELTGQWAGNGVFGVTSIANLQY